MPIYKFYCTKCNKEYLNIVKMSQEYDQCPDCGAITKRTHCDLPNPPNLVAGQAGGFYKPSYGTRDRE